MAKVKSGFKGERAIVLPSYIIKEISKDFLCKELFITDIGYYPKAKYHYRSRKADETEQYILIYCISGEGFFEIDGKVHQVETNQFFILPPKKLHKYGANKDNPWTIYWVHFQGDKAAYFAEGFDKPSLISPSRDSRIEERLRLFEDIFSSLNRGYGKNTLYYVTSAFFYFLASMKFLGEYRGYMHSTPEIGLVENIIHFMQENIQQKLTLEKMAEYVKLSSAHFSTIFKNETGYTPINYLNQLRIKEACHYLDFTDLKLAEISDRIGVSDPYYLSKLFYKIMGMSPTEYKNKVKG